MKILVVSDSHGSLTNLRLVLEKIADRIDMAIHLGDNAADIDGVRDMLGTTAVHTVPGNCDYYSRSPITGICMVGGKRILFTHGHSYHVKRDRLCLTLAAEEKNADICLFGHTHIPELFVSGAAVFMNPGSIARPRGGEPPSYGIVEIEAAGSFASIVSINKHGFEVTAHLKTP